MKRVLIAFNDVVLLSVFKRWMLRSLTVETVLFAKDGKKALEILAEHAIELLITDLQLQDMSGLELVACVSSRYPRVKTAFFLPLNSTIRHENLANLSSLYFIHKPDSLKDFIRFEKLIRVAIFQALAVADIRIVDFLKLAKYQHKTCLLEIDNLHSGEKGAIYLEAGVLHDAVCGDFKADLAVMEMLSWEKGRFVFKELAKKLRQRKIQSSLTDLIAGKKPFNSDSVVAEPVLTNVVPENDRIELPPAPAVMAEADIIAPTIAPEPVAQTNDVAMEYTKLPEALYLKICALKLEAVLEPLQKFDHYLAFAIFDMTGQLVMTHNVAAFKESFTLISQHTTAMITVASRVMPKMGLGKPVFIQISSHGAVFQLEWIIDKQLLAIILLNAEAKNTGLVKLHLDKACHYIRNKLC